MVCWPWLFLKIGPITPQPLSTLNVGPQGQHIVMNMSYHYSTQTLDLGMGQIIRLN